DADSERRVAIHDRPVRVHLGQASRAFDRLTEARRERIVAPAIAVFDGQAADRVARASACVRMQRVGALPVEIEAVLPPVVRARREAEPHRAHGERQYASAAIVTTSL